jgi:hypothetical protein
MATGRAGPYADRCWYHHKMTELRKITVRVSQRDLEMAQAYTGEGVTGTVRAAIKKLASMEAQKRLHALRGKVQFSMTVDKMRE